MESKAKRDTTTNALIQMLFSIVLAMVVAYAGMLKMGEEFWQLFQWWGVILFLGIAFYPLSAMIFRRFDDRGYLFSKAIGLVVTGWLMWLLASLRILPFTSRNCYVCLGVCALCNYIGALIYYLYRRKKTTARVRKRRKASGGLSGAAEDAKEVKTQAETVRSEAEEVKARAEAIKEEAAAIQTQIRAAGERKRRIRTKASRAQAEALRKQAEALRSEAEKVRARADAIKAEAEAIKTRTKTTIEDKGEDQAQAEAGTAETLAAAEARAAEPKNKIAEERVEAEKNAVQAKTAKTKTRTEEYDAKELEEDEPYVIKDVSVKVLNVKPAKVKEVRFKTSMTPSKMSEGQSSHMQDEKEAGSLKAQNSAKTGTNPKEADDWASEENRRRISAQKPVKPRWERILVLEMLFFILFVAYMYMKGFNPKAYGTEKMMDYGFMMSMFKTEYFPVEDFWFAGESLNYYYFGQYIMTFLTKLSFNTVNYGYNLALGTGFAFCATLVYALVYQVMRVFIAQKKKSISNAVSHVAGAVAAVAVTIAGNGHYIVFNRLVPMLWDILQIPGEKPSYWFPESTRYIGYVPDTHDKTIHEFPSYSFILGDVHAHVVNITFVLTLTAVLFAFLMNRQETMKAAIIKRRNGEKTTVSFVQETFRLPVIAVGYLIGIFMMSNYWDFPIYYVVAGAVILVSNAVICGFDIRTWGLTAMHAVIVLAIAFLVALPFNLHFVPMANGILFAETHTPLYQLIILWGFQAVVVIGFVTALIWKEIQQNKKNISERKGSAILSKTVSGGGKQNRFVLFLENLEISDLFILILGLCAIGLVLTPEVIYMSDIYAGDYKRSNTMFKLVYQAFILFGVSLGYILTRFVLVRETRKQLKYGIVGMVLLLWTCGYFGTSVRAWFGDLSNEDQYMGMRADRYIYEEQPMDAAAIAWLNENVQGRPVILEANGDSYTIDNRVSVLTGLPTVLGWRTHEWLWHNSPDPVDARAAEIQTIYTSQDSGLVRTLLDKYQVTYLYIGTCEYKKYELIGMDTEILRQMGEVVYEGYPDMWGHVVMIVKVR